MSPVRGRCDLSRAVRAGLQTLRRRRLGSVGRRSACPAGDDITEPPGRLQTGRYRWPLFESLTVRHDLGSTSLPSRIGGMRAVVSLERWVGVRVRRRGDAVSLREVQAGSSSFGIGVQAVSDPATARSVPPARRRAARLVRRHRPRWVDAVEQAAEHISRGSS